MVEPKELFNVSSIEVVLQSDDGIDVELGEHKGDDTGVQQFKFCFFRSLTTHSRSEMSFFQAL